MLIQSHFNLNALDQLAIQVCAHLENCPILLLKGNLGSGKTSLCKRILKHLSVEGDVNSPTFNIVNTYTNKAGREFYHFDLYRIKQLEELEEFGFFEYLDSGEICLIEWPEIAESSIDIPYLLMEITPDEQGRCYRLSKGGL